MSVYKKTITNTQGISIKRLEDYLNTLKHTQAQIINKGEASQQQIQQFDATIANLKKFIAESQKDNIVEIKDLSTNLKAKDIVNQINAAFATLKFPKQAATGEVFEDFLTIAGLYAEGKAGQISDKLIEKTLLGGQRSNVLIHGSNFSSDFVDLDKLRKSGAFSKTGSFDSNTNYTFKEGFTQDKLDVQINWYGDTLNISAKNYKLKDDSDKIHLVSGTSLLYIMQNENVDFINHWLNTVTVNSFLSNDEPMNKNLLQEAHTTMKTIILAKALTGQNLGRNGVADTFVLNHRTKKKIYVWTTKQFFDACEKNINNLSFKNYPNTIKNTWVGTDKNIPNQASAKDRISNLIAKVHTYKLHVSVAQKHFSNLLI